MHRHQLYNNGSLVLSTAWVSKMCESQYPLYSFLPSHEKLRFSQYLYCVYLGTWRLSNSGFLLNILWNARRSSPSLLVTWCPTTVMTAQRFPETISLPTRSSAWTPEKWTIPFHFQRAGMSYPIALRPWGPSSFVMLCKARLNSCAEFVHFVVTNDKSLAKVSSSLYFWLLYSWFAERRGPKSAEQQSENCQTWGFCQWLVRSNSHPPLQGAQCGHGMDHVDIEWRVVF